MEWPGQGEYTGDSASKLETGLKSLDSVLAGGWGGGGAPPAVRREGLGQARVCGRV